MNGKKAKKLRKQVYGDDYSSRYRKYTTLETDQIIADYNRRWYQNLKKKK